MDGTDGNRIQEKMKRTMIYCILSVRVLTYHNSEYALANHSWTEPLDSIYANAQGKPWQLLTPRIGEQVKLNERQTFSKWWR